MPYHFNNDAERVIALKRSRLLVAGTLFIVLGLLAFCMYKIINH